MYVKKKFNFTEPIITTNVENMGSYKPFSYYILGGSDITGDGMRDTNEAVFEADELLDVDSEDLNSDGFTDPRVSFFDMLEAVTLDKDKGRSTIDNATSAEKPSNEV